MLRRLKKTQRWLLEKLARKQEMLRKGQEDTLAESSQASLEAGNVEKTQKDKPAESSEASPWCAESLCIRASK